MPPVSQATCWVFFTSADFYGLRRCTLSFWLQLDDFNNVEFDIRTPEQWLEPGPWADGVDTLGSSRWEVDTLG